MGPLAYPFNFNKTEWTNSAQNDTTITATLVTNSPEYNLFKNPVIEIQLPQEVEKVVLGETRLLYNDNLSIKKAEVIDRNNQKVIRIELNGTQNAYITNSIVNGVNVVIPATIIVKKDIESTQTNAYYAYLNETATGIDYELEGKNCKNIGINITVPQQEENAEPQETQQEEQEVISANLDAEITAKVGNDVIEDKGMVHQGEVITYTYKITNNTGTTVNGIKAVATVPNDTVYVTTDGSYIVGDDDNEYDGRNPWFIEKEDIKDVTENMDKFELGIALSKIYDFMWDEFCDWYIEMAKYPIYHADEDPEAANAALWTLREVLKKSLKLLHPYMPFVTEEIYSKLVPEEESLMMSDWPVYEEEWNFPVDENIVDHYKEIIRGIRNVRAEMNVPNSRKATAFVVCEDEELGAGLALLGHAAQNMAALNELVIQKDKSGIADDAVSIVVPDATVYLPLEELIDFEQEIERLTKEEARLTKEIARSNGMLNNEKFVSKAPAAKVQEERDKLETYQQMMAQVKERLEGLKAKQS